MKKLHLFSQRQHLGLCKVGQCLLPTNKSMPSFQEAEKQSSIETMLNAMNSTDRFGLKILLFTLSFIPMFILHSTLKSLHRKRKREDIIGVTSRKILMGLRGVTYTLYYTHQPHSKAHDKIYKKMGWESSIQTTQKSENKYSNAIKKDLNPHSQEKNNFLLEKFSIEPYTPPSLSQRVQYLQIIHTWILENMDHIINHIQKETGKSRNEIVFTEIFSALENIKWLIGVKNQLKTKKVATPMMMFGKTSSISFEPLGRVLIITAWNYPFYQAIQTLTTSFLCGNQTLVKPSEWTPLQSLMNEIINILPKNSAYFFYGDGHVAEEIIASRPEKIFFTGSESTATKILKQASEKLIPVELELGGKDAAIVLSDAQLSRAVPGILWGSCVTSGQACSSVEIVFIHQNIFNEFKNKIIHQAKLIQVGDERHNKNHTYDYGPILLPKQIEKIRIQLEDAIKKGAHILYGKEWDKKNPLIHPIIIENISFDMLIMKEETFGPIIPLISFQSSEEVIKHIHSTHYGLSASIWGSNKEKINYFSRRLKVGSLSINNVMASEGNHNLPFGGTRRSGFGRHKGLHGLHGFTHIKSILKDSNSKKTEVNWFPSTPQQFKHSKYMLTGYYGKQFLSKLKFIKHGIYLEYLASKNKNS
ncbi:MAG: aldehyde dehydrogenase family protein [Oligoflexales bacterium]